MPKTIHRNYKVVVSDPFYGFAREKYPALLAAILGKKGEKVLAEDVCHRTNALLAEQSSTADLRAEVQWDEEEVCSNCERSLVYLTEYSVGGMKPTKYCFWCLEEA